jgi:hypothetical protein
MDEVLVGDATADDVASALAADEAVAQKYLDNQPYIERLEDAIDYGEFGLPTFKVQPGGDIVIERYIISGGERVWLDTKIYEVIKVDHSTGDLRLYDNEWQHCAMSNFKTGVEKYGYRFKIAPKKGKLRKRSKVISDDAKLKAAGERKSSGKRGNPGRPGLRRVYNTKGVIHTRLKGHAFGPGTSATQACDGDRLEVSPPDNSACVKVTHPTAGWTETWSSIDE